MMKHSILLLISAAFLFYSCSTTIQPDEEFVQQLFENVASENNEELFNTFYLSTKKDIKMMLKEFSPKEFATSERINEMYSAAQEDKNGIARRFNRSLKLNTASSYQIDSFTVENPMDTKAAIDMPKPSKGVRVAEITVYISSDDERHSVTMACLDLKKGRWQIAQHPRIRSL